MIQIVFQNNFFIVCDKPAQVLSVPSRDPQEQRPCLGLALQAELKKQIFPVHRLDYEVSGLIIYAVDAKAHQQAQNWFMNKSIQKNYSAVTELQSFTHWPSNIKTDRTQLEVKAGSSFNWNTQILRGKKRSYESIHGDWATTQAQILKVSSEHILWKLYPVTGKAHQLRLELSRRGFPILNDVLYGSQPKFAKQENFSKGIALRAYELHFLQNEERFGLPESLCLSAYEI